MAYVMMAIPSELVSAVTELVEGTSLQTASEPGHSEVRGFANGWDHATVRRAYRDSANKMRSLLRFLADHPGEEVTSEQIADAINAKYGWNTVAGMLGAFGRRAANRYRRVEPMWEYRYDDEGRVLITMPSGAAKVIQAAAQN